MAFAALVVSALALIAGIVLLLRFGALARRGEAPIEPALRQLDQGWRDELARSRGLAADEARQLREEVTGAVIRLGDLLQRTVEGRLEAMRADNAEKLEAMRATVDEKLHKTLEDRLGASFKLVSDQLEQVFKSVGEMQALAAGVGDLKRVLTNVKARGTWGEVSLGGILAEVLTAEQYDRNVEIRPGSNQRVEFAIRLPGADGDGPLWLPIDAKFPTEDYERLSRRRRTRRRAGGRDRGQGDRDAHPPGGARHLREIRGAAALDRFCAAVPADRRALCRDRAAPGAGRRLAARLAGRRRRPDHPAGACSTACAWGFAAWRSSSVRARCGRSCARSRPSSSATARCSTRCRKSCTRPRTRSRRSAVRRRQIDRKLADVETLPERRGEPAAAARRRRGDAGARRLSRGDAATAGLATPVRSRLR